MRNNHIWKKAQMFMIELGIAILLFTGAVALYYQYVSDIRSEYIENLDDLFNNAKDISASLISSGYASDWDANDVQRIGLTNNNNKINETKLASFNNISYEDSKFLLSTSYDFYVFFEDRNGDVIKIINSTMDGIGRPGVNSSNVKEQEDIISLVKVNRIVILNSDIARMVIYVWSI